MASARGARAAPAWRGGGPQKINNAGTRSSSPTGFPDQDVAIGPGVTADQTRLTVSRGGIEVLRLTRQLFQLLVTIAGAGQRGTTPQKVFDRIFGNDPAGGPLVGAKTIQVQRVNLNRRLAPTGLYVTSRGAGAPALYSLVTVGGDR